MERPTRFGRSIDALEDSQIEQKPGFVGQLLLVGLKTGLWKQMQQQGPITVEELGARTHSDPIVVENLLTILKHHGLIFYDNQTDRYALPPERVGFCFSDESVYIVRNAQ